MAFELAQRMNCQAASFFFEPAGMPKPCTAAPGKRPAGPRGTWPKAVVFTARAGRVAELGEVDLAQRAHVAAAGLERLQRLVGGVGDRAVGPELAHQAGEEVGRGNRLRRVQ